MADLLLAGSSLDTSRRIFERTTKHRPASGCLLRDPGKIWRRTTYYSSLRTIVLHFRSSLLDVSVNVAFVATYRKEKIPRLCLTQTNG